jgi:tRNA(Arg) A34 adenosine deaminase TadA
MGGAEVIAEKTRGELIRFRDEVAGHGGDRLHDHFARIVVAEAIDAGLEGNAAVGALLASPDGEILLVERNRMLVPFFRSDYHAEMVLLSRYEEEQRPADLHGYTLVTSLEPCEMCMIRIVISGVSNVLYVAEDLGKGGITGPNKLAANWARLAASQHFALAECDERLAEISLATFEETIGGISDKLMARRLPDQGERSPDRSTG